MRRVAIVCCLSVLAGCGTSGKNDSAQSALPRVSLADIAGKWTVRGMTEKRDSTLVTYQLTATADTSGWALTFPNRPPLPLRVSTQGSNVVTDAGPYESVLRKGVRVTIHWVFRLENGKLEGTTIAHYSVPTADSVRRVPTEATRAQ